tara:strand:+ start:11376 stop:11789 length:414 start_codon:yes stop_codon:yes gene_type:complete
MTDISRTLIATPDRVATTAKLFSYEFSQRIEPFVYTVAREMAPAYSGGYWLFYRLSNEGFYMAPDIEGMFDASCASNFFQGKLSADALGIVACLTAYSNLSFGQPEGFARTCADQFYLLRDYAGYHREAAAIYAAID